MALALASLAALWLVAGTLAADALRPAYHPLRATISELGEVGAPNGSRVSWGVFFPVGLALAGVAWLERPLSEPATLLAAALATGYLTAALFPCDPGSPLSGSARQGVHNLGGGIQYVAGLVALWRLSGLVAPPLTWLFAAGAFLVGIALVALSVEPLHGIRGAVQRVAEVALFGGLLLAP